MSRKGMNNHFSSTFWYFTNFALNLPFLGQPPFQVSTPPFLEKFSKPPFQSILGNSDASIMGGRSKLWFYALIIKIRWHICVPLFKGKLIFDPGPLSPIIYKVSWIMWLLKISILRWYGKDSFVNAEQNRHIIPDW